MKRIITSSLAIMLLGIFLMSACASKQNIGLKDFRQYKSLDIDIVKIEALGRRQNRPY